MKIIPDHTHGIIDYATVLIFALAPDLLGFTGTAALISYALAGIHLAMTLLTSMPLGIFKIIPMKLHSVVELCVGSVLIIGAFAFPAVAAGAQPFFILMGVVIFLVWLFSHYGQTTRA
jgi:hypothetical protein